MDWSPTTRQGDKKLVYTLIGVFSSTEIFSKRRKIFSKMKKNQSAAQSDQNPSCIVQLFLQMWVLIMQSLKAKQNNNINPTGEKKETNQTMADIGERLSSPWKCSSFA